MKEEFFCLFIYVWLYYSYSNIKAKTNTPFMNPCPAMLFHPILDAIESKLAKKHAEFVLFVMSSTLHKKNHKSFGAMEKRMTSKKQHVRSLSVACRVVIPSDSS